MCGDYVKKKFLFLFLSKNDKNLSFVAINLLLFDKILAFLLSYEN